MSVKRTRRKPQGFSENRVAADADAKAEETAQGGKSEPRWIDDLSLETQRRSIAYGRARGLV